MVSLRMYMSVVVSVVALVIGGLWLAAWSNGSGMGRFEAAQPVSPHVDRDVWMEAARMGAPVYRAEGGPVSLPLPPADKTIVISGEGYVFATDDVADVVRWYGMLTYPTLNQLAFPTVRYVYEVEAAEMIKEADGGTVLSVTVHESRTGCVLPACDPITQLPNYDRRYTVKPSNAVITVPAGKNA